MDGYVLGYDHAPVVDVALVVGFRDGGDGRCFPLRRLRQLAERRARQMVRGDDHRPHTSVRRTGQQDHILRERRLGQREHHQIDHAHGHIARRADEDVHLRERLCGRTDDLRGVEGRRFHVEGGAAVLVGHGVVYLVAVRELHLHAGGGEAVVAREPDGHQPRVAGSVQNCSLLSVVS